MSMDGWAIARRIVLVVAVCLVQPFLCAGVTWHRDLKSWQIDWRPSVNYEWQWRDQWSIPFTPYQANIMRSLIEEATASPPMGSYEVDLSKWPPIINGMWERGEINACQMISLTMWYEGGSYIRSHPPQSEFVDSLYEATLELSREQLSPEWAVIVGRECTRHIHENRYTPRSPSFYALAKGFFEKASALDPGWDAPYSELMLLLPVEAAMGTNHHFSFDDPYESLQPYLYPSPGTVKAKAHQLMRQYMAATDYQGLNLPPWATKAPLYKPMGYYFLAAPMSSVPPTSVIQLLLNMSISERNADDFAFVLEFISDTLVHNSYYNSSLSFNIRDIRSDLANRIADREVMDYLNQASKYLSISPRIDVPNGEYRKLYPNGEVPRSEVIRQMRNQDVIVNVITPLKKAAARMRELGPKAFAPKGMHDAIVKHRREAWDTSAIVWPFSDEASSCWDTLPPKVELTQQSKLAVTYLLGWQLLPKMGNGNFCEQAWKNHSSSLYNDPEAGFAQRATVAYWTPYYRDEYFLEKAVAEIGDNDDLLTTTPEWAYTAWALTEKGYIRYRTNLKGYDKIRDEYRPVKMKYITLAADMAPDWVQAQKTRLETAFELAMDNAAKAAGTDKDHSRHTGLDFWMPFVSDGDAQGVCSAVQAFVAADDCRVLLPLPWAVLISKEELAHIAPSSNLLRMYDKPEVEYSYSTGLWPEEHLPVFLIKHGCGKKRPKVAASAFLYMKHLYELNLDSEPHPTSRAWDLKKVCDEMAPYLADTSAKMELMKLADDLQRKCSLISGMYHYQTTEFQLSADELAAAKSANARQEAEMNAEILNTARKMAEIVAGLKSGDFVVPASISGAQ